jgi:hypothetical protein
MTSTTSSEHITLQAVKAQFDQWRKLRPNRCKIPQYLWDNVKQLTQNYSYSQISSQLRISYQQLSAHCEQAPSSEDHPSSFPFVSAQIPVNEASPHSLQWLSPFAPATLEIQGANGLNLKATGLDPQELPAIIQTLFCS